jgi:hypothetical protein
MYTIVYRIVVSPFLHVSSLALNKFLIRELFLH